MKLTKKTIELICELEKIIGNQCYNPNSYNGYTMEYGKDFRYPVHYKGKDKLWHKTSYMVQDINKDGVSSMYYSFGSNQLNVGNALVKILERLEREYDLDFDELVKTKK